MRVMVVLGTRPEAIKMAPVVHALRADPAFEPLVAATAQHRDMLDQVLRLFDIVPDCDLDLMRPGQELPDLTARILVGVSSVIAERRPDLVLVHGDTTTTLASALAGFYAKVPVAHVEAGLRSHDLRAPWPEELNRKLCATLCSQHFAPTPAARDNLVGEGVDPSRIHVTGNTVIDALLATDAKLTADTALRRSVERGFPFLDDNKRLLLVTIHRRENFGSRLDGILRALATLTARDDLQIVYPVHPNPAVSGPAFAMLSGLANLHLVPPQDYLPFVYLMRRSHLILTDSGGIQEEAPSLGKPVLVARETTERPEALAAGTARLVGSDPEQIVGVITKLLDNPVLYAQMARAINPYGDGKAAERIRAVIR